jgi:hypothetical protein
MVDLPGGRHIQIQRYFQSVPVAGALTPVPGAWLNPSESGSGFGLDYENGTLIVEVYSYLAGGASQWYLAAGPVVNNVFTGTLDKYRVASASPAHTSRLARLSATTARSRSLSPRRSLQPSICPATVTSGSALLPAIAAFHTMDGTSRTKALACFWYAPGGGPSGRGP